VAVMLAQLAHAQCHIRLEENNRQGQERRDDAADDGNKIKEESQQPKERGKIDLAYGEDDPSAKARPCERAREREKETHAVFCRSMFLMVSIPSLSWQIIASDDESETREIRFVFVFASHTCGQSELVVDVGPDRVVKLSQCFDPPS
jgi:hypothetical protein